MDTKKIGQFLRNLRREHNLTQEELGEKLGATNKTISRWETGTYMPPADILLEMSKLYGVSVNEILSGERLATTDYHNRAEQNIVTSLNDNSIASKRNKKILIICIAVILSLTIASVVLVATLTLQNKYITVTFDSRGGSSVQQYSLDKNVKGGHLIDEPMSPILEGHSFVGWFYDKWINEVWYQGIRWDFNLDRVQDSITLYAKWEVATDGLQYAAIRKYYTTEQDDYQEINGYSVEGLDNLNVTDIVIPSYYNGKPVQAIGFRAFEGMPIKSITIPDTVTSIGSSCFAECTELAYVQMGKNVSSLGGYVFSNCTSLKFIDLPNSITRIYYATFGGCTALRNIKMPSGLLSIEEGAFINCTNLVSVTIGPSVLYIHEQAFINCPSLIEIRNESTHIVDLSKYSQFDGVLNKYRAKDGQSYLRSQGQFMFYDDNVNEPLLIKYYGDEADITLPDTFYGKSYSMRDYAFNHSHIVSVTIPSSVKSVSNYAFEKCNNLTRVIIENGVTTIGKYAFRGCSQLSSVKISDSVTTIDVGTFLDCVNLSDVDLGGGVTNIEWNAFCNCAKLENIVFPESLQQIERHAFYGCGLKELVLPSSLIYFDNLAFANCNLESVSVDQNNTRYRSESNCIIWFNGVYDEVKLGCKNSVIPTSVQSIAECAFYGCKGLQSIYIPSCVIQILFNPFKSCNDLLSITVNEDNPRYHSSGNCIIETATKTIVVMGKNFVIPNDGSVEKISKALAYDYENGDQVEIPNTITRIEYLTFYLGTYYTINIVYDGTMEQWRSIQIINSFNGTEYELPMHVKSVICTDGVISSTML